MKTMNGSVVCLSVLFLSFVFFTEDVLLSSMMRWNSFDRPPRSKDHGLNLHSTKWGLGLREDQADDFTWLNNMPVVKL